MRLSKYNTYLNVSSQIGCIYNSLSDKTIVFRGNAKDIERHNKIPTELQNKFIDCGILVNDDVDEYVKFLNIAKNAEIDDSNYHLIINPTLNCNFHCSYCYESHFSSKMNSDIMTRVKQFINRQFHDGKNLTISFFGGEPMLYYEDIMKPLITFAISRASFYDKQFSCNMTSNGYLLNEEKTVWLSNNFFSNAQITLDGSKDIHNKTRYRFVGDNTYDRIISNIKLLAKYGIGVTLRLNCTHKNIKSLNDIAHSFDDLTDSEKKKIIVDIQVVWQENDKSSLINKMDSIVSSFQERGIPAAKMDFSGFCYADRINSSVINFNGDIYKCTAKDFSTTPRDGFINDNGFIIWENDSLNKRMQSKFKNPYCKECRIFPLCHGGCSTNSLENINYCMHDFNDDEKDNVVKNRIIYNSNINNHE